MADRYFQETLTDGVVRLDPETSHHLARVLRARPGDELRLFDGRGGEARAVLEDVDPRHASARVLSLERRPPLPARRLTLAFSPPKAGRVEVVLRMAVELGACVLQPVHARRTPPEGRGTGRRWPRILAAAAGQCGATWLPELHPALDLAAWIAGPLAAFDGERWVATPGPEPGSAVRPVADLPPAVVVVGPEGDFEPAEHEALRGAGCRPLPLGPHVLRVETACAAA
ncbi:MAG: RsmE family RNA methyltransferase, partial [Planctomycetota bacterium]